jgi:hypothetical protein
MSRPKDCNCQCGIESTLRYTFWNTFFSNLKPFLSKILPQMEVIKENTFVYKDIPNSKLSNKNIILYGYFQSYKYFQKYYKTICNIIKLDKMKEQIVIKYNIHESKNEYLQ